MYGTDNMNQNEYIRSEFASRRKTTGPTPTMRDSNGSVEIPAVDTATFESSQDHATINAAKGIDMYSNPNDGKPC